MTISIPTELLPPAIQNVWEREKEAVYGMLNQKDLWKHFGIRFKDPAKMSEQLREDFTEGMELIMGVFSQVTFPTETTIADFVYILREIIRTECTSVFQHAVTLDIDDAVTLDENTSAEDIERMLALLEEQPVSISRSAVYLLKIWWVYFLPRIVDELNLEHAEEVKQFIQKKRRNLIRPIDWGFQKGEIWTKGCL